MKKYFVTGLVILLPLAITIALVVFIVNFLTQPFMGLFEEALTKTNFYAQHRATIRFILQIVILGGLFFFTVLLGFLARVIVFKSLISIYDYFMHRIPIVKTVYKAAQQVMKTIFGSSSQSFKQVVMVPFPTQGAYCIGLVSSPAPSLCIETTGESLVTVFVPTTPNPTSGFLMMYKQEEVIFIDMKIEEAFKYIISCGVITQNGLG